MATKAKKSPAPTAITISVGSLFTLRDAIQEERQRWRIVPVGFGDGLAWAVREGGTTVERIEHRGRERAEDYIYLRALAEGLRRIGIMVEPLP